jgi:ribonucleotide monophosphatase NagD (HAD superfamily)
MLVTNPDMNRPGSNAPMPGRVARLYEEMGGRVSYLGKPHSLVYNKCFEVIDRTFGNRYGNSRQLSRSRICGVGDSLEHDIEGAHRNGIGSIFIANGVHVYETGVGQEAAPDLPSQEILDTLYEKYQVRPHHTIAAFR